MVVRAGPRPWNGKKLPLGLRNQSSVDANNDVERAVGVAQFPAVRLNVAQKR